MITPQKGDQSPPNGAAHFYVGDVMHHRMKPVTHRFAYQVFSILIDLAKLDQANRTSPFFSVNRFNLMSFHEKDHGPRDGSSLRAHVDACAAEVVSTNECSSLVPIIEIAFGIVSTRLRSPK